MPAPMTAMPIPIPVLRPIGRAGHPRQPTELHRVVLDGAPHRPEVEFSRQSRSRVSRSSSPARRRILSHASFSGPPIGALAVAMDHDGGVGERVRIVVAVHATDAIEVLERDAPRRGEPSRAC